MNDLWCPFYRNNAILVSKLNTGDFQIIETSTGSNMNPVPMGIDFTYSVFTYFKFSGEHENNYGFIDKNFGRKL